MIARDQTAIVGVGSTRYFRRGQSLPRTELELFCHAVLAATDDAGLSVDEIDGFACYSGHLDLGMVAQTLGLKELRFGASVTGGGNGAPGSVGLASMAVASGQADVVVSAISVQQAKGRMASAYADHAATAEGDFLGAYGLLAPGQMAALIARRQMHRYGIRRQHYAEVAISQRNNAIRRSTSLQQEPLTLDDYFGARMVAEPLCLFDYSLESDGAVAVVTTSAARARDLRHRPVYISASAMGGDGHWGRGVSWMGMPDDIFATGPARPVANALYGRAGVGPADVDVALFFDHFTPAVLAQLEMYGFCGEGESGAFVADGNIRWPSGSLPVNTHGGNLSEAFIVGMTHVKEAVEQLRGTAVNQVSGAEIALVGGTATTLPVSSLILRR
jgi:acetyl-CoA acetyltransferase